MGKFNIMIQTFRTGKKRGGEIVANELRELRKEKGETQIELAQLLGLKTASAYCKKENGSVPFSLEEVKILSYHFNKPISFFCK